MVDKLEKVTQADRDAAADLCAAEDGEINSWARRMRSGKLDGSFSVQAFARHRLAATPANGEQVERDEMAKRLFWADTMLGENADRIQPEWRDKWWDELATMPLSGPGFLRKWRALADAATPTEDARSRVKVLEEALLRIAETDRHTRRVKCNPNGGLRGQAGMIAVFALTGKNGSHLTDADVRTALGNKETDRHG